MNQAQQAKAQAAQQVQEGQQAAAAADASFNAAQQAANEARALLASQQVAAASEALGRADSAITAGQDRINDLARVIDNLNTTISQQADHITALTVELQQARTDKQTILNAYNATRAAADEAQARFTVNPAVAILAGGFLLAVVLVFVAWKWQRSDNQPVITVQHTAEPEVIEGERIEQ
jgi:DNA repair exonuclease SbcCD ATPase subunit